MVNDSLCTMVGRGTSNVTMVAEVVVGGAYRGETMGIVLSQQTRPHPPNKWVGLNPGHSVELNLYICNSETTRRVIFEARRSLCSLHLQCS